MVARFMLAALALVAACAAPEPWAHYTLRFPVGFAPSDRSAVLAGAAVWSHVDWEVGPDYDGALAGGPSVVYVETVPASDPTAAQNPTWLGWTTMNPDGYQFVHLVRERWYRAPAIAAHELGHAMGIHHVTAAGRLMSAPIGAGSPTPEDWAAFCEVHSCTGDDDGR